MGDRTPASLTLLVCPPEVATRVWNVVTDYFTQEEWDQAIDPNGPLVLGRAYTDQEVSITLADELRPRLDAIDGIAYELIVDSYGEYPQDIVRRMPGLGTHTAIGSDGTVSLSHAEVEMVIERSIEEAEAEDQDAAFRIRQNLRTAFGVEHEEMCKQMLAALQACSPEAKTLDVTPRLPRDSKTIPYGTTITVGHPANKILAVRTNSDDDEIEPMWRYVNNGARVEPEAFRAGWDFHKED